MTSYLRHHFIAKTADRQAVPHWKTHMCFPTSPSIADDRRLLRSQPCGTAFKPPLKTPRDARTLSCDLRSLQSCAIEGEERKHSMLSRVAYANFRLQSCPKEILRPLLACNMRVITSQKRPHNFSQAPFYSQNRRSASSSALENTYVFLFLF